MENHASSESSEPQADNTGEGAERSEPGGEDPGLAESGSCPGACELECDICFSGFDNVFKLPKLLACGHTFCLECLARINVSSETVSSVSCPLCRRLTPLPSGKGLPALDNNLAVLRRLPSGMRSVPSIRFSRDKGKLYTTTSGPEPSSFLKPTQLSSVSLSLDVGQPAHRSSSDTPPRTLAWLPFRSSSCYYVAIGFVLIFTVALVLSGIFLFVIVPTRSITGAGPSGRNGTTQRP
ncbi:RING finger protein 225-like [Chiloscyllium plagiosum]|uniref:RING finger protein 225-like n=1 Tax=Chiloscyllium plagiosum TaxID=36176 RepID=UPI001CB80337|nr:RING finger protein 225-like [Chiloscyllium plagiosum]